MSDLTVAFGAQAQEITVRFADAPLVVRLGENTAEAARQAGLAEDHADAAAADAAAARAAVGQAPAADTTAGLGATSEGGTFWVDQGDGTGKVYRHDAGPTATEIGRFSLDITDAGAAALMGTADGGTAQDRFDRFAEHIVYPEDYGDLDTPATAHITLQDFIDDALATGAMALLPNRFIETKNVVYIPDGLHMEGSGPLSVIYNTGTSATGIENHTLAIGQYHPNFLASNTNAGKTILATWHNGGAVAKGSYTVTLSTPAEAANYAAGDVVTLRSRAYWFSSGGGELPHVQCGNVVVSADSGTGVVTLLYPAPAAMATSYLTNWMGNMNSTSNTIPGRRLGPVKNVRLKGFKVGNDASHNAIGGLGAWVNADIDIEVTNSTTGVSANGAFYSRHRIKGVGTERGVEIKCGSCDSTFDLWVKRIGTGASVQSFFSLGEAVHNLTVNLWAEDEQSGTKTSISTTNANGNTVNVMRFDALNTTGGAAIDFTLPEKTAATDAGETQNTTADNTVNLFCTMNMGALTRNIYFVPENATAAASFLRNRVVGGAIRGEAPSVAAITFARGADSAVRGVALPMGGLINSTGSPTGAVIDVVGSGLTSSVAASEATMQMIGGAALPTGALAALAVVDRTSQTTVSETTANTVWAPGTLTVPAATLIANDQVHFHLSGIGNGSGANIRHVRVTLDGTGAGAGSATEIAHLTFASNSAAWAVEGRIKVQSATVVAYTIRAESGTSGTRTGGRLASQTLNASGLVVRVEIWTETSGSLAVHEYALAVYRASESNVPVLA